MDNEIRILLVDDNLLDVERTLEALRRHRLGGAVRVARGGQEALDYLFARGQFGMRRRFPLPDAILLDLNMPRPDGYEVLAQVRAADALRRIPVSRCARPRRKANAPSTASRAPTATC